MKLGETFADAIRKLHGAEDEGAGSGQAVREEPPLKGCNVGPFGIFGIDEKVLVVAEDVREHQPDESKDKILCAQTRSPVDRNRASRHVCPWSGEICRALYLRRAT